MIVLLGEEGMMTMTTIHEIEVEGHKLVARALNPEAPGEPIFLIHGITASINFWSPDQFPLFLEHGPTYLLSLPGHYPATTPPQFPPVAITPEMIAQVLASAIRRLVGSRPVTLVGHSTGGFASLSLASFVPDLVSRVVSISGFAQGRWTGALGLSQGLARRGRLGQLLFKASFRVGRAHRALFRAGWRIHLANDRALSTYPYLDALIDQFYPDYRRLDLDMMVKYFRVMPQIDITPCLASIKAPTLALTGDKDPTVPPAQARLIAQEVPGAELEVIPGGGHFLFMECPVEYRAILRRWLAKTTMPEQRVPVIHRNGRSG
jgi:pimeloyl-ACP methyl ester carboxylesterase